MGAAMADSPRELVTVHTWVECGLRLGLSAPRTLELYRESGGAIRTGRFMALWRERRGELIEAALLAEEGAA